MKSALLLLILVLFFLLMPHAITSRAAANQAPSADRKPVVVELFTSEGCSSCPPADALLKKLETEQPIRDAEIIGLEEHVDYWNQDGWFDPYSSSEWTLRQQEYVAKFKGKGPYTPQMIVAGERELVGNNARDALQAVHEAANKANANVTIAPEAPAKSDQERFDVKVAGIVGADNQEPADIWMAVTEDGLGADVKAGENAGKNVQHASVVRSFHKIGSVAAGKDSSAFSANPEVKFKSNWKKENLRIVVFVQGHKSFHILGAASTKVAS